MSSRHPESAAAARNILLTALFAVLLLATVGGLMALVLSDGVRERLITLGIVLTAGALAVLLFGRRMRRLVGELVAARHIAEASEARFIAAAGNSPDAFSTLEAVRDAEDAIVDFRITYENPAAQRLWHNLDSAVVTAPLLSQRVPLQLQAELLAAYAGVVHSGASLLEERQQPVPGVGAEWLEHHVVPLGDGVAATWRDISQRHRTEERLKYLAQVDSLTGLPNRSVFYDRLDQALLRSHRSGKAFALMFLDIDHFKDVNDRFGHAGGDALLRKIAERLRRSVRSADTVARLAGDEFTVILEELQSVEDADRVAATILRVARTPLQLDQRSLQVTLSIGMALYEGGGLGTAELLNQADAALYEVKRRGRNAHLRYTPALATQAPAPEPEAIAESGIWPLR